MKFSAGDLRFRYAEYTDSEYSRLMDAVALSFREKGITRIFLGYDARLSSPRLSEILTGSLSKHGIDTVSQGSMISSCAFYWNCLTLGLPGVMITASHNPKEWNGLKIVGPDLLPYTYENGYRRIEELMGAPSPLPSDDPGRVVVSDRTDLYVSSMVRLSGLSPDTEVSVLIDYLHGVNAREIGSALSRFPGIRADHMHSVPDGDFPAGPPNTLSEPSIAGFKERLRRGNYDLGIVFDGDGDRTAVYTGDGRKVESLDLMLQIGSFMSEDPKYLADGKTPALRLGNGLGLCRTGQGHIKRMMADHPEEGWTVACEGSGHFFWSIRHDGRTRILESSMLTLLLVLRAYTEERDRWEASLVEAEKYTTLPEISRSFEEPGKELERVRRHFEDLGASFTDRDALGRPLGSLVIVLDGCQIYQHESETERGIVRWQITEWRKHAADAALRYLN